MHECRVHREHTQLHTVFLTLLFLPKSTPDGDFVMCDPLWRRGSLLWVSTRTLLWPWLHSEHLLANNTCVCWSSCLSHLQPPLLHKERSRMLEKMLFVLPSWHASTARLKDKKQSFGENMAAFCFYVVVAVLLSVIFFSLSLSSVPLAAASKVKYSTMGAKCGGCCGCFCWLFLLMNKILLCVRGSVFIWEKCVCLCLSNMLSPGSPVSCSHFIELEPNIHVTLLLLYKLYCHILFTNKAVN